MDVEQKCKQNSASKKHILKVEKGQKIHCYSASSSKLSSSLWRSSFVRKLKKDRLLGGGPTSIGTWFLWLISIVPGGCSQGSPSTCMGNLFLTWTMTWLHWASLLPEDRKPVLTWPIWRQFSRPTTSISLSPISCVAWERSMSETLLKGAPWSFFFLLFLPALLRRLLALESPHILVPPCVDGIFKKVIPCRGGPSLKFSGTPSHISWTSSCKFLHEDENCSEVAYSKYHSLFFIRLLNFWGFFSLSWWNFEQMAASTPMEK